jgi:hypothetical protein
MEHRWRCRLRHQRVRLLRTNLLNEKKHPARVGCTAGSRVPRSRAENWMAIERSQPLSWTIAAYGEYSTGWTGQDVWPPAKFPIVHHSPAMDDARAYLPVSPCREVTGGDMSLQDGGRAWLEEDGNVRGGLNKCLPYCLHITAELNTNLGQYRSLWTRTRGSVTAITTHQKKWGPDQN